MSDQPTFEMLLHLFKIQLYYMIWQKMDLPSLGPDHLYL